MKPFQFQQFSILQSKDVFRVGTDAVLLGALANCAHANHILEVGTGTGVISLMLAQRNPTAQLLAIDIDENAVILANQNFQNSPFQNRLESRKSDFKQLDSLQKFDLIVSNPPYFDSNDSEKDVIARQRITLGFQELIIKSSELLSENGILSVIIPSTEGFSFIKIASENHLNLIQKIEIKGIETAPVKRLILEFSVNNIPLLEKSLTVEKSPRVFTDSYLELTRDFHVFRTNKQPF